MSSSAQQRSYRWLPDVPDFRDFKFAETFESSTTPDVLPLLVDLESKMSLVEDQSKLGSCTANALVGDMEYLEGLRGEKMVDLSRLFVYYNERVIERTTKIDSGAFLRDGIKTLAKQGVCSERTWPYVISKFATKPPAAAYKEALTRKIKSYHRLDTLTDMKTCLASGYPFVFGFSVYTAFESAAVASSGTLYLPKAKEEYLGGHAVLAVGYNDKTKRIKVRNSWGPKWGKRGYFTMPYSYVTSRELADDFWVIQN